MNYSNADDLIKNLIGVRLKLVIDTLTISLRDRSLTQLSTFSSESLFILVFLTQSNTMISEAMDKIKRFEFKASSSTKQPKFKLLSLFNGFACLSAPGGSKSRIEAVS